MRDGMNALAVIYGIKKKWRSQILAASGSSPLWLDRSGLIHTSIETLQRDLLEELSSSASSSFSSCFISARALIPILTTDRSASVVHPDVLLHVQFEIMSLGGLALAIASRGRAIVMVENGYRQLSEHPSAEAEGV